MSHCANETYAFAPNISSQREFDEFLFDFFPDPILEPLRNKIREQYNCTAKFHGNFRDCIAAVIQDSSFTCNTRDLFESNPKESFMMKYTFPDPRLAFHAADLIPLFRNNITEVIDLLMELGVSLSNATLYAKLLGDKIPETYQKYFASFALYRDPNKGFPDRPLAWPVVNGTVDQLSDVMEVIESGFDLTTDDQNAKSTCSFWTEIARELDCMPRHIDGERIIQPPRGGGEL